MDAAEIERRLRELFEARAEAEEIAAAWLFGEAGVGVLFQEGSARALESCPAMQAELARLVGAPVELVVLNHAPPDQVMKVLREERLLLNQDPSRRVEFEVRTRQEYWDMEPYLRLYRHRGAWEA
jgi:hypothetical protein